MVFGKHPDGTSIEPTSLVVRAPSVVEVRLPVELAANSQFVTTGTLAGGTKRRQRSVGGSDEQSRNPAQRLLPTGTSIADSKGMWTSNNQTVSYALPVIARQGSAARKRIEAALEEFRQTFPAALCYTKIVPVDEVVTLTLYHREDEPLKPALPEHSSERKT